ncbi:type VI-B CRISPR accessory protein Csx28 [Chryseobacterium gambrini]|uniref:Uncharacterized protein n=1 Tax=Chryseobacterium gambrini TaxID=373672 RepID=A0ABM8K642_9FLAO|nr:hypothetical protein CRDW_14480 [Chryseobacterium gambrini]
MEKTNLCLEWAKIFVPVVGNLLILSGNIFIFIWGLMSLKKRLKTENVSSLEKLKYEKVLKSHEKVWDLLAYLSENNIGKSIFTVKGKEVQMNRENAEAYIKESSEIMYNEGVGLYISKEVIQLMFTYQGFLKGILKHSIPGDKIIIIKREDTLPDARKHYENLNIAIKQSIAIDNSKKILPK